MWLAERQLRQREQHRSSELWHLRRQAQEEARRRNELRHAARSMATVACTPRATDAVRLLHRPWSQGPSLNVLPEMVPGLLRVRGTDWCATLARGMVRRARARIRSSSWPFTEALMRAVGTGPPDTPGAVAQYVAMWRGPQLAAVLAADPWLDHVLPYLFDDDRVAAVFSSDVAARDWPPALVELAASGRVDRPALIGGCLRRLRAGGRTGVLQPYLALLKQLGPGTGELAGHRQELTGLLTAPLSTVAGFAYTSLQQLHRESPLDAATLAEITLSLLSRPEKKLVRAHLAWLRPLPLDDVVDGLVVGLHHPVPELAEQTLDLVEPRLAGLSAATRERLKAEVPALDGAVAQRLGAWFGMTPAAAPVPVLVADLPAGMPPPLDLGALAGELATTLRRDDDDPVRYELILDGLVRAANGDRAAAARVLRPLVPQWVPQWRNLIGAVAGPWAPSRTPSDHPLAEFIEDRALELAVQLMRDPPPALLATPATVVGHVDPARVLGLLQQAERDGRQPGDLDLTQALLRLPREVDVAVHTAAARLTSPAGRRFAAWLAGVAEPRTWVVAVPQQSYRFIGRLAMLDPAGLPAGLADPRTAAERARVGWSMPGLELWPMVTPSHREVAAAHVQAYVAAGVDNGTLGAGVLEGLAAADGPPGPAMALTMAYALANHRETARLAAGDALITLAARPDWDSTGIGTELAELAVADRIVLQRTLRPLTDALKAGAHDAVWQVTSAALPALLAA
ncbi:hypothetical protein, partial [Dactylosporangium fulvum]